MPDLREYLLRKLHQSDLTRTSWSHRYNSSFF